jgi:hypothetical protein
MKTRPIIVIIVTLAIGFILGMLTSAQLRYSRLRPMRMYFSDDRSREGFYRIIQPDEKQKDKIDEILDRYLKANKEMQDSFRKELDSNIEAMRKELEQNLTKDQIVRLKEMDERRMSMMREAMKRHRRDTMMFRHRMGPGHMGRRNPPVPDNRGDVIPPPPLPEGDTTGSPR